MVDNPRINELRRRVLADPASIAFAQLGEECRRAGANDEAVIICRNGLSKHPGYLSARITLGRALIELGELDDAKHELDIVVHSAPDNLAAIRGLAEIAQQQGRLAEALAHYRHALTLASHDADLEDSVDRISQAIAPPPPAKPADVPAIAVEELFDFDKLLAELGEPVAQEQAAPAAPQIVLAPLQVPDVLRPTDGTDLTEDDIDEFAAMERDLRALDEQRAKDEQAARELRALEEQRLREEEEQLLRDLEEQRLRDEEEQRVGELEAQRLLELELQQQRELELQQQRELELQRELQRLRELEEQRQREAEEQLFKELEEVRLRALEEDRQRELDLQRQRDEETARLLREEEEQRAREAEEQRAREAEKQRAREAEQQRAREAEAARVEALRVQEELEAQRVRQAEDARRMLARRRQQAVVSGLESWLSAVVADRDHHSSL